MIMKEEKIIVFGLDEDTYCMDLQFVRGIEENYRIIPVPNCPGDIKGIINLRGEVIPVYSLRSRFQMDELRGGGKLLLTHTHNTMLAFEVDAVHGIETLQEDDIFAVPTVVKSEETTYVDRIVRAASGIVINISVEDIVSDSDFAAIEQILADNE